MWGGRQAYGNASKANGDHQGGAGTHTNGPWGSKDPHRRRPYDTGSEIDQGLQAHLNKHAKGYGDPF